MADTARAALSRLEDAARGDSPVHRLHPGVKGLTALFFVAAVVSLPVSDPLYSVPFLVFPFFVAAYSGTPWGLLLKRLCVALPFSLMAGISRLFTDREAVFVLGAWNLSAGTLAFTAIILKTLLAVSALLLLAATTPLNDLTRQMAACGLPKIFCLTVDFAGRYASVLLSEAADIRAAYALRAGGNVRVHHAGVLLGQWFLRSVDRAERVYQAMRCRGFTGVYPGELRPFTMRDVICLALAAFLMLVFRLSVILV